MSEEGKINIFAKLLKSYRGRDSIIRTVGYLSLYISSQTRGSVSRKLKILSQEMSYSRLIMRLFDDFPMLQFSMEYGLGSEDKNILMRILGVMKNLLDQIYFPVEHVAWAADKQFIKADSSFFYTIGTALWGLSSYLGIVRGLVMMSILQRKTRGLKNIVLHEKIVGQQMELLLMAFKDAADVILAIHYLPYGSLLWAGQLDNKKIGLIGTISSFLRLLLIVRNIKYQKETS